LNEGHLCALLTPTSNAFLSSFWVRIVDCPSTLYIVADIKDPPKDNKDIKRD
jgi:hypothetical protein